MPEIEAKSYLLVDFQSGEELAGINAGMRIEPASITKLMTAYIVYQELGKGTVKMEDAGVGQRKGVENGRFAHVC